MRLLQQSLLSALVFALTAAGQNASYEGYVFAYFTGDTLAGENIYFGASNGNNALSWTSLNGGQPVLKSNSGTKGLRDPYLLRSHDGSTFYLLATDLSIGSGTSWSSAVRTGSRYIEIFESQDLTTWSAQRHVLVSPPTAGNTWAPKAYYDDAISEYVVYWASELYAESDPTHSKATYERIMYATTSDFISFSAAMVWQDTGINRIDSTVLEVNGTYYRFTKDDGDRNTGCKDIIEESSQTLLVPVDQWAVVQTCIGLDAGIKTLEGPSAFKSNPGDVHGDKFYLFADSNSNRGYLPLETADIAHPKWVVSSSYSLPKNARHGSVIGITAAELKTLTGATPKSVKTKRAQTHSPVLAGFNADPNIIAFNQTYYIYPTTDGFPDWSSHVFYVWKSNDLTNWTRSELPIITENGASGNVPWATGYAWAPTIMYRAGKYYFYFSGANPTYNRKTIGVAVANSPEGPFTAQPKAMILDNEAVTVSQAIDSMAFLDPQTNKYYLFWGSGSAPLFAELNDDMVSIKEASIKKISGLTSFREGSFVNYRKGLYHYTYSVGDTRSVDYSVGYATATSVQGPWTYQGIILKKDVSQGILGTGHNSILQVPGTDDWYICYHRFAIPNGNGTMREVTIDKISFNSNGIIQTVIPTLSSVQPEPIPVTS